MIETLIGPVAACSAFLVLVGYVFSVALRERRGREATVTSLARSRPVLTMSWVLVIAGAVALLLLRLGVMS